MFIDEEKKKNRVWSFHCLYGDLLVQSTQNLWPRWGKAVPVKKAASLGMAASNSGDNTQEVPRGENNGSHSSAEGQKYGCD